jgi:hypothetical protein
MEMRYSDMSGVPHYFEVDGKRYDAYSGKWRDRNNAEADPPSLKQINDARTTSALLVKSRIQYEHTKQTHPASATVRGLRKELNDLMALQRKVFADMRVGVAGAFDQLQRGEYEELKLTLIALKALVK